MYSITPSTDLATTGPSSACLPTLPNHRLQQPEPNPIAQLFFGLYFPNSRLVNSDIKDYCFSFLNAADHLALTATCKSLARMRSDRAFWKHRCSIHINLEYMTCFLNFLKQVDAPFALSCPLSVDFRYEVCLAKFNFLLNKHPKFCDRIVSLSLQIEAREEQVCFIALELLKELRVLNLSNGRLAEGMVYLCEAHFSHITELNLQDNDIEEGTARALSMTDLSKLKVLNIASNLLGDAGLRSLLEANLSSLEKLDLSNNVVYDGGIEVLSSSNLENLKELNLSGNRVGPVGAAHIASNLTRQLEVLDLCRNQIGAIGAQSLANADLTSLKVLKLSGNDLRNQGVIALMQANLNSLEKLYIRANQIEGAGLKSIVDAHLPKLKLLDLGANRVAHQGKAALSRVSARLTELDLCENNLDDEALISLASGDLSLLRSLDLSGNMFGQAGILALVKSHLCSLRVLSLAFTRIGDFGVACISCATLAKPGSFDASLLERGLPIRYLVDDADATSRNFSHLEKLNLMQCAIEKKGVEFLARAKLSNLEELNLQYNPIGEGVISLLESYRSGWLSKLRRVNLTRNHFSKEVMDQLIAFKKYEFEDRCQFEIYPTM